MPQEAEDPNFGASKALPARDVARLRVRMLPYLMSKIDQGVCFNKCAFKVRPPPACPPPWAADPDVTVHQGFPALVSSDHNCCVAQCCFYRLRYTARPP